MRELREYFRPSSAQEAVDIKSQYGAAAVYLGGGSDLLVHKPRNVTAVIDTGHAGIGYVRLESDAYVIGGSALLRDVENELGQVAGGMLRQAVRETAPWLIRNAATLAGNIANASPAADSVPALLVLDAELLLLNGQQELAPLGDIFEGPHRTKLGDRLIQEIRIPRRAGNRHARFIKFARSKSDIAQVNLAVSLMADGDVVRDVRIAMGAVAPFPMRATVTEALVEGERLTPELLLQAEESIKTEVRPISDWRASAEYRRRMCGVLLRRTLHILSESLASE